MPRRLIEAAAAALLATACASAPPPKPTAPPPPPIAAPGDVHAAVARGDGEALRQAAGHADALIRAAALRGLGHLTAAADTRLLRAALRDEDARVRAAAAWAAGRLAAAGAIEGEAERDAFAATAAGALATERDPVVRRALIRAVGQVGRSPGPLLVAAVDEAPAIRADALYALGTLADAGQPAHERAAMASAAVERARDPEAEVRVAAAWLLARLGDPTTEEWLSALARDEDPQVRAFAARGLGAVATRPSLLEALLGDRASAVRVEAAAALLAGRARAAGAGARGGPDLAMEEAFANAIDRSVEALAREVRTGTPGALHALIRLGPAAPSARHRAAATSALQEAAAAAVVPAVARAQDADLTLRTSAGALPIALDDEAAPVGAAHIRSLARAGALRGARIDAPADGVGRWFEIAPAGGSARLPVENTGARWDRGTVGLRPDGTVVIALGRLPDLDGSVTPIGRVAAAIERLDRLPPGGTIEDAVLH